MNNGYIVIICPPSASPGRESASVHAAYIVQEELDSVDMLRDGASKTLVLVS